MGSVVVEGTSDGTMEDKDWNADSIFSVDSGVMVVVTVAEVVVESVVVAAVSSSDIVVVEEGREKRERESGAF